MRNKLISRYLYGGYINLSDTLLNLYPEVSLNEEPWAIEYFRNNPNVAGMAIGEGLNGIYGNRRVIVNPYNKLMKNFTLRNGLLTNERLRHYMDENNFNLPNITNKQFNKYKGTPYENDTINIGRTEAARYLVNDTSNSLTNEQIKYVNSYFNKRFGTNLKYKLGGIMRNKLISKYLKGGNIILANKWIRSRGVNGEYGYLNLKTNLFRTTIPNSKEENKQNLIKRNKAALTSYSSSKARFNRFEANRRNHSSETIKKIVNTPILTADKQGNINNTYNSQLAPSEDSVGGVDPVGLMYVEGVMLNPVFKGLGRVAEYGLAKAGNNWVKSRAVSKAINLSTDVVDNPYYRKTLYKTLDSHLIPDDPDLLYHQTVGKSKFTSKGLIPGKSDIGLGDYIFWNEGSPYASIFVDDIYTIPKNKARIVTRGDFNGIGLDKHFPLTKEVPLEDITKYSINPVTYGLEKRTFNTSIPLPRQIEVNSKVAPLYFKEWYSNSLKRSLSTSKDMTNLLWDNL